MWEADIQLQILTVMVNALTGDAEPQGEELNNSIQGLTERWEWLWMVHRIAAHVRMVVIGGLSHFF